MATKTFTDYSTIIDAEWCNDVDAVVWDILGGATTYNQVLSALNIGNHHLITVDPSGDLRVDGNTTLGNASGDSIIVNAGTLTLNNTVAMGGNLTSSGTITSTGTVNVSGATLTLANDQISGDKIHGGTISNFTSTGIDDNAASVAITIDGSQNVTLAGTLAANATTVTGDLTLKSGATTKGVIRTNASGNLAIAGPNVSSDAITINSTDKVAFAASSAYRNVPRMFIEDDVWTTGNLRAGQSGVWEGSVLSVSSITRSGSTATVTVTAHGYSTGDNVYISGADQTEYNGVFQITVVDADTFTCTVSGTPATPATGTITVNNIVLLDPRGAVALGRVIAAQAHPLIRLHRQSAVANRVDGNERARIGLNASDYLTLFNGANNTEQVIVEGTGRTTLRNNSTSATVTYELASSTAYAGVMNLMNTATAGGTGFDFCRYYSGNEADIEFRVRGDGQVYSDAGTAMSSPADYAEMVKEWWDGNTLDEDRVGRAVVLVDAANTDSVVLPGMSVTDTRLRLASTLVAVSPEAIIGIISAVPAIRGGSEWASWKGKHQKDKFGRYVRDAKGARIVSPKFDKNKPYTPREDRKEWDYVGLLGRLPLLEGEPMNPRWIQVGYVSPGVREILVR